MGRSAKEGKSPVLEIVFIPSSILSTARHAKSRRNPGGPSPNPKYSLVTDSEPVPGGKGEKHPGRGVK